MSFLGEIRRRNVFRVAVAYAAIAWVLIQIADVIYPAFELPPWVMQASLVMVVAGFVVTVVLAWIYELTPDGIKRTEDLPAGQSIAGLRGRKLDFVIIGVLVLGLAFVVVDQYVIDEGASSLPDGRSIAVLPFADLSPNGDQEYFGDGIAEELRKELTRLDGLNVAGRTSSSSFKDSEDTSRTIGEALGVEFILEGSIRKDDDEIRITATLIDVATGFQTWTQDYDENLNDIFLIQEDIATLVAGNLGVRLGVGGINAFRGAGTQDVEAYVAYLEGLSAVSAQEGQSVPFFELATRHDPNYAAAWAQLGLRTAATRWNANPGEASEAHERGYAFVLKAVALDPESAQSHSMLGTMLLGRGDWIGGEKAHAKALSLLSDRSNLTQYGNMLMRAGRTAEAAIQLDAAQAVEPLGGRPTGRRLNVSIAQGKYAEAREMATWFRELEATRLDIALNEGDPQTIRAALSAMPPTNVSSIELHSPVLNDFDSSDLVLSTLRAVYDDENTEWPGKLHDIALLAAYFDDADFAFQAIAREVRDTNIRRQALWYPIMTEVRQLPEFKELVTDLNLVAYWRDYGWADSCRPLGDDDFTCS